MGYWLRLRKCEGGQFDVKVSTVLRACCTNSLLAIFGHLLIVQFTSTVCIFNLESSILHFGLKWSEIQMTVWFLYCIGQFI